MGIIKLISRISSRFLYQFQHRIMPTGTSFENTIGHRNPQIAISAFSLGLFSLSLTQVFANAKDESEEWEDEEENIPQGDSEASAHLDRHQMALISGNGNRNLSAKISQLLKVDLAKSDVDSFKDGECAIRIEDNVRGRDVFIIQPTCPPINDRLIELFLLISTLSRASAGKVTAVIPYYGYARQDRKREARETIAAADIARMLKAVGVDHVIAVDLHRSQLEGFFDTNISVDNLDCLRSVIAPHLVELDLHRPVIISTSETGAKRVANFRETLLALGQDCTLGFIVPNGRDGVLDSDVTHHHRVHEFTNISLVGEVMGCDVVIVDDMIDTGSRITMAAEVAKQNGARRVIGVASHGLFSNLSKLEDSLLDQIIVSDTIPPTAESEKLSAKITYVSVAPIIADAIQRAHKRKVKKAPTDQYL